MPFRPVVDQTIHIAGTTYRFAEHPAAPGIAYGQQGRAGTVWQLIAEGADHRADEKFSDQVALKVFLRRYVDPAMVTLATRLARFADLIGMRVCRRTVLEPGRHGALLRKIPELTYAVAMPWITGPNWAEIVVSRRPLEKEDGLALAMSLAGVLARLEQRGIAHCDLSASNLILVPARRLKAGSPYGPIELVDVEQIFGPGLDRPRFVPSGSMGYAHRDAAGGLWGPEADRFAGAVLLAEILGWADPRIRAAADGESYFPPALMQQAGDHVDLMLAVLRELYGHGPAELFEQAWRSDHLNESPTFGEWQVVLSVLYDNAGARRQTAAESEALGENGAGSAADTLVENAVADIRRTSAPGAGAAAAHDLPAHADAQEIPAGSASAAVPEPRAQQSRIEERELLASAEDPTVVDPGKRLVLAPAAPSDGMMADHAAAEQAVPEQAASGQAASGQVETEGTWVADAQPGAGCAGAPQAPGETLIDAPPRRLTREQLVDRGPTDIAAPAAGLEDTAAKPPGKRWDGTILQALSLPTPPPAATPLTHTEKREGSDDGHAQAGPGHFAPDDATQAVPRQGGPKDLTQADHKPGMAEEATHVAPPRGAPQARAHAGPVYETPEVATGNERATARVALQEQLEEAERNAARLHEQAQAAARRRVHVPWLLALLGLWLIVGVYLLIPALLVSLAVAVLLYLGLYLFRRSRRDQAAAALAEQAGLAARHAASMRQEYDAVIERENRPGPISSQAAPSHQRKDH